MRIPVYLFTGFLDSGKTRFIQSTLEDERFNKGERTLLLVCEEGEEEFYPERFSGKNVYLHTLDDASELTPELLNTLASKYNIERCVIEYNGMWQLNDLYAALPENWMVYQEMMFADASSFTAYNQNMRSLVVDKLQSCELVIFNRMAENADKMPLHKIVRGVSRQVDIAYEYSDDKVEYDDIVDPLPFDVNADVIVINDGDFALWYRDMTEEPDKYDGKTVTFRGQCALDKRLPKNTFAVGRHVMTCCADDIQYVGIVAEWDNTDTLSSGDWINLKAKIKIQKHKVYKSEGPVLYPISVEKTDEPAERVATFY